MTRRFLHNGPWSSLLDAWSEAYPRLRHTVSVRDDRLPSKQAARRAPPNSAVASAACLEGPGGPLPHLRVQRHPAFPTPSVIGRAKIHAHLGRVAPRECEGVSHRHCEPTGRANARPMTGSAKQSISPRKGRIDCFVASLLAMTIAPPFRLRRRL